MLLDSRISKWAKTLVNYSVSVKPADKVMIRASYAAMPLVKELYREILKAGGQPDFRIIESELSEIFLKEGSDEQIMFVSPAEEYVIENYDAFITIGGENNLKSLSSVSSAKLKTSMVSRSKLNAIYFDRASKGKLKWVITHYPTHSSAQESGMSSGDFEDFVMRACYLDKDNPVAEWNRVSAMQERIIDFLKTKKNFRYVSRDTDLSFSTEGRIWINSDGRHNFPSGEVFTSPIETSINGKVRFTYPAIYSGKEIEDISMEFKDGEIVSARAKRNDELLQTVLSVDEGAKHVGEAAIGTNYGIDRFVKNMLFDEKIGGTIHIAIGNGFEEAGGRNKSAIHWDMLCDMKEQGEIYGDNELFYKNGKFLIKGVEL
ncbi:MAG: aminopeptidase [bacterium]|nr:aminopeptidase [bacterium]